MRVVGDEPFPKDDSASREDPDVIAGLVSSLPDHALELPSRVFREAREFLGRDQEQVEPIPDPSFVPDAQREKPWGPPTPEPMIRVTVLPA